MVSIQATNLDVEEKKPDDARLGSQIMESSPKNSGRKSHMRRNRNMTAQVVNNHAFTLLPVLEGKWSGDAFYVDEPRDRLTSSTTIYFDHERQAWDIHVLKAASDSVVKEDHYFLEPTGLGSANVVMGGAGKQGMIYNEVIGSLYANLTLQDEQGNLVMTETWSLNIQDAVLTRVRQMYDNAHLARILVSKERKL
eukprot:GEMP01067160.1.p1 GENE.GEMP01067160.1~~GEMP01067160.1.p1  ORF type:complete len:202 (+),score=47.42 GEMP01067160.1:22-606(+)